MSKIFEVDFRKGSLKDRVSGLVGTIFGAPLISRAKSIRGLQCTEGTGDRVEYVSSFPETLTFSISGWFDPSSNSATYLAPFSAGYDFLGNKGFFAWYRPSLSRIYVYAGSSNYYFSQILDDRFKLTVQKVDDDWEVYYNGELRRSFTYTIDGYTSVLEIGRRNVNAYTWHGAIFEASLYNDISEDRRNQEWVNFQKFQNITRPLIIKRDDATDMIVSDDATNWNADGVVFSADQAMYDYQVESGSFKCLEDSTGKYIECVSSGSFALPVNLSIFTGSGYLRTVLGDLSGDQGGTVDAASAFFWADNLLSIAMTTGQKLRGYTIVSGA